MRWRFFKACRLSNDGVLCVICVWVVNYCAFCTFYRDASHPIVWLFQCSCDVEHPVGVNRGPIGFIENRYVFWLTILFNFCFSDAGLFVRGVCVTTYCGF